MPSKTTRDELMDILFENSIISFDPTNAAYMNGMIGPMNVG